MPASRKFRFSLHILDMEHEGLDVSRLKKHQTQQDITHTQSATSVQKPNIIQGVRKALQQRGGSKDGNREHEVGTQQAIRMR